MRRVLFIVAAVTALVGAPLTALAALPNQIGDTGTSPAPNTDGGGSAAEPIDESVVQLVLGFGLLGVAGVTIVGSAWLAATRRRDAERRQPITGIDPVALERRAQRRRGDHAGDDPVVGAKGLTDPRRRARAARPVKRRSSRRSRRREP